MTVKKQHHFENVFEQASCWCSRDLHSFQFRQIHWAIHKIHLLIWTITFVDDNRRVVGVQRIFTHPNAGSHAVEGSDIVLLQVRTNKHKTKNKTSKDWIPHWSLTFSLEWFSNYIFKWNTPDCVNRWNCEIYPSVLKHARKSSEDTQVAGCALFEKVWAG